MCFGILDLSVIYCVHASLLCLLPYQCDLSLFLHKIKFYEVVSVLHVYMIVYPGQLLHYVYQLV